ncbi:nuclear transport factor 2 family protein [Paraburkholderia strydomiana]|uniref:nuclear transport factor 2 family protein n=1 Tax=Paraburkholderia strydomiana TaxID=1245417 RepID=UPI0038B6E68D
MSDLEARIKLIEDRIALEDLLARYRNLADDLKFAEWADAMFTEDAVFDIPRTVYGCQNGRGEIKANSVGNNTGSWEDTMHLMINPEFNIDGDTARGTVDMLFYAVPKGMHATSYIFDGARYAMSYRRTKDGWRISRIEAKFLLGGLAERAAFLRALAERNKK